MLYEINIAELAGDLDRARDMMAYLSDLGITGVELMPLSNVGVSVDWGYLPIGYFGVDERFGRRSDFQQIVDIAHQHGLAVIVDVVYGHTGVDFPYYEIPLTTCNIATTRSWDPLPRTTSAISAKVPTSSGN